MPDCHGLTDHELAARIRKLEADVARKDAALEEAEAKLCWARNFLDAKDLNVPPDMLILRGNIVIGINEVITLIAKVLKTKKGK